MPLRRNDDDSTVEVQFNASTVPFDPALVALMTTVPHNHDEPHSTFISSGSSSGFGKIECVACCWNMPNEPVVIRVRRLPSQP